jgi:hypothetical protein
VSAQLDSQLNIEWVVASGDAIDAAWQNVDSCAALFQPIDPPPPALDEDEWWPGRCIA